MKAYAIFDLDGTLADSMGFWRQFGREYLAGCGIDNPPTAVLDQTKSMTVTEAAGLFLRTFHLQGPAADIAAEMNAVMAGHYHRDIPLKPGVRAYLDRLRFKGVRMAVASATDRTLVEACLRRLGVLSYFEFVCSCEEVGAGKERPDVFLEAARRLGAPPRDIAVYEDSLAAVRTAKAAGFHTVAVYDPYSEAEWSALQALAGETIPDWSHAIVETL